MEHCSMHEIARIRESSNRLQWSVSSFQHWNRHLNRNLHRMLTGWNLHSSHLLFNTDVRLRCRSIKCDPCTSGLCRRGSMAKYVALSSKVWKRVPKVPVIACSSCLKNLLGTPILLFSVNIRLGSCRRFSPDCNGIRLDRSPQMPKHDYLPIISISKKEVELFSRSSCSCTHRFTVRRLNRVHTSMQRVY